MRPHPRRADTDPRSPRAWGTCDRCGFILNHHKLQWQFDWRGKSPKNLQVLICPTCLDQMQRQLGTVMLPPDPPAILNARPENYAIDEQPVSTRYTMDGRIRVTSPVTGPLVTERIISTPGGIS